MRRPLLAVAACALAFVGPLYAASGGIQVLSATVKDQKITGASVILQKNGQRSTAVVTDGAGRAMPSAGLDDPETLLILKKDGYSDLVVKCPCDGLTYAMSPVMRGLDGLRVVLNWGEQPEDLDSHLTFPGNHVYWDHKQGTDANLDVDDTDSFGPETITLERMHPGETYVYSVHDFSHRQVPGSSALGASGAQVFVYVGESLVRTYYVPRGRVGNLWSVFRIDGNGELQDINQMSGATVDASHIDSTTVRYSNGPITAATASAPDIGRARSLNRSGEQAYRAGDLGGAIGLYQQAISADPNYGQAYSNLGLAYVKANQAAEAIWASRKAIGLAEGPGGAKLRAASYYNIGKLYEQAGQRDDALRNYTSARREAGNPAYDKAIQRLGGQ